MATPIIRVDAPQKGTGAFIAFAKDPDGTVRQLAGWEYNAYVAGGNPVTTTSSSGLASTIKGASNVIANVDEVRGYGGTAAGTAAASKTAPKKTSPAPTAPTAPTTSSRTPSHTGEDDSARAAREAEDARRAENQAMNARNFVATLRSEFPWLDSIGLDPGWFQQVAADASGPAEILVKLRATPQYKRRFPGMYRQDGSVRMNEAQYMAREQDYRNLLRQYGFDINEYSEPAQLQGFFDSEMDPNEFEQRLDTYRGVQQSSRAKKDAFYVYAGLDVSDEDLYAALVDPAAAQNLTDQYNAAVAAGSMDYGTWITRATEVGNRRVADTLTQLQKQGAVTGRAVQTVLGVDSGFARQIMDAIYTGGSGNTTQGQLSLEDLLNSFEYAAIGAAAKEAGLDLPTKERLAEIRQAGVEKAAAIQAYSAYGLRAGQISASVQRAGYDEFTQDEFERSQFLGNEALSRELSQGLAAEEAAGRGSGEFRFSEDRGRLMQRGFGVRR